MSNDLSDEVRRVVAQRDGLAALCREIFAVQDLFLGGHFANLLWLWEERFEELTEADECA